MRGLLLKDFYMAKKYCRMVLCIIVIFLAVSLVQDSSNVFYVFYPVVIASILPVSLQAYDEKCKWVMYGDVFPYSRKQLVSVKYLMSLFFTGTIWTVTFVVQIVRSLHAYAALYGAKTYSTLLQGAILHSGMLPLMFTVLGLSLLSSSILLVVIFKLGTERGRVAYMSTIAFICVGSSLFMTEGVKIRLPYSMDVLSVLFLLCCVLSFALSWFVSVRIYQKKEF